MYKIRIKGTAHTEYKNIEELYGIDCQDCFSEYFDGDESYAKDITGGYMHFEIENGKLMTITEYNSKRELTPEELEELAEYTQGQWSDGIGEGFEQYPCYNEDEEDEVYISPWHRDQVLISEQIKL